jgi:cyclase
MLASRIIPVLLVKGERLVKGVEFKDHRYCGDVMNAIRIFSGKEADELILLDIDATPQNRTISESLIRRVSRECMMPFTAGGGIRTVEDAKKLFGAGTEKVALNTAACSDLKIVSEIAGKYGSQSVVVSLDVRRQSDGSYKVFSRAGQRPFSENDPVAVARKIEDAGAGEILLNSIDRDGSMSGYDLELIEQVSESVGLPVIALGGAGNYGHLKEAFSAGASAAAAGSMFVFHTRRRAVLINYPSREDVEGLVGEG